MTQSATQYPLIGNQSVGNWFVPDTTQRHPLGTVIQTTDPYWGGREMIYLSYSFTNGTALQVGAILAFDVATSYLATLVANTAIMGKSVAFANDGILSTATTGTYYIWAVISGQCPVWCSASVAANTAFGIVAAGQGGALAAGKQIVNARVTLPATTTVVKANTNTFNGNKILKAPNADGWFVGVSVSGTGITTSLVTNIDPDNRTILLASNSSATGSVSATGTYNDATNFFNIVTCDRPFAQGAIT
jgi:hypothetical protein